MPTDSVLKYFQWMMKLLPLLTAAICREVIGAILTKNTLGKSWKVEDIALIIGASVWPQ